LRASNQPSNSITPAATRTNTTPATIALHSSEPRPAHLPRKPPRLPPAKGHVHHKTSHSGPRAVCAHRSSHPGEPPDAPMSAAATCPITSHGARPALAAPTQATTSQHIATPATASGTHACKCARVQQVSLRQAAQAAQAN
jgi:hypothetical protein